MVVESDRRRFLVQVAASACLSNLPLSSLLAGEGKIISDMTGSSWAFVIDVESPKAVQLLAQVIREWSGTLSVAGAKYSMGGHTLLDDSLHINMRTLNQLVWLKPQQQLVRVQAGMSWLELQKVIDQENLAVSTMQSFANFFIGGSVSVNCHGRYVNHGPIVNSIESLQLLTANGDLIEINRQQNSEIFNAVVGGYGGLGIITEVELRLQKNQKIERVVETTTLDRYVDFFTQSIAANKKMVMHNADLAPPNFDQPLCISYVLSEAPLTEKNRLHDHTRSQIMMQGAFWLENKVGNGSIRKLLYNPTLKAKKCVWLNYEASLDVNSLAKNDVSQTVFALQEYFVPVKYLASFVDYMRHVFTEKNVAMLNISIRHAPHDATTLLSWAKTDVFCLVLYYEQKMTPKALKYTQIWARALIDHVLSRGGSFYLPYHLHASKQQVQDAYPNLGQFISLKKRLDPNGQFKNQFWEEYL